MKIILLTAAASFVFGICFPQGRTSYWPIGYASYTSDTLAGGMTIEFSNGIMSFYDHPRKMDFFESNASICNDTGQLLFYTNGIWIANIIEDTMLNGTGLNPSWFTNQWDNWGMRIPQGDLIIPKPGSDSLYYLFHETVDIPVIYYPNKLYVTTVNMQGDSGRGEVIDKNKIILNDTLIAGALTACRHGNGRDWWLLVPEYGTELGFYTFLITPDTIQQMSYMKANAGGMGRMQACFAPDGSKYVISNWWGFAFYDFDRCSGTIAFNDSVSPVDSVNFFGASVSPNSRYAYTAGDDGYDFYQYDLQAADISLSQALVAQWDTFAYPWPPWWTAFYMHQIGPDGKIYIECPGTTMAIHVIDDPDSAGIACDVQQHALLLPHFNATIPNFPNYNLGALAGSVCDTLTGIADFGPDASGVNADLGVRLFPNPNNGTFRISYRLPQNKEGMFEVFDVNGRKVHSRVLPRWSTVQQIKLHEVSDGIYNSVVTSAGMRMSKKIAIVKGDE